MLNKWLKVIISAVVVVGVIAFFSHNYVNYFEKQRKAITLPEKTNKTLFFYRDDCSDCQSIFHHVYWQNVLKNDVVFVNMNQIENRKYITKYNLKSVPTFINKDKSYTGTDLKNIDKIMGD